MVGIHYRWDFIGLSTDQKPTPETSEKVVNGSTFYCSDNSKLYVFCDGTWYERKPLGGGGGGGGSYVAGNGIDITDDTISVDTTTIQPKLTAGSNVTISDDTISATNTTYSAGTGLTLTGTEFSADTTVLATQNDLSSKQNTLTAGSNITISDNTISATDTTYSNFVGTDGTAAGTAGLVPAPGATDAGKFLKADGTWDTAGGGSGPTVVQTTGTSTTDVMSQNAVTSMVFADPATQNKVKIGSGASSSEGQQSIEIGKSSAAVGNYSVALGSSAKAHSLYAVSLGSISGDTSTGYNGAISVGRDAHARARGAIALGYTSGYTGMAVGEMHIGSSDTDYGYNSSNYRLLTGLYDPQSDHDAATKGYVDGIATMGVLTASPTGTTVGVPGRLYTYDTGGGSYEVYLCVHDNGDDTYVWKQVSLI